MKTASVKEPSIIAFNETENPVLNSGDILVQMHACGICGSDLEKVFGEYGQPSMRLGHEPAGVIIDVSSDVTAFKKGDRVLTHHHVPCYSCHLCKHGNETMCPKYYETNLSAPETTYATTIDYYGYFDSSKCYDYDTGLLRFVPRGMADGQHYCTGTLDAFWRGNFLNWATMARIDAVRKILFGGHRRGHRRGNSAGAYLHSPRRAQLGQVL